MQVLGTVSVAGSAQSALGRVGSTSVRTVDEGSTPPTLVEGWSTDVDVPGTGRVQGVADAQSGDGYLVAGQSSRDDEDSQVFVAGFDVDGDQQFATRITDDDSNYCAAVQRDDGRVLLVVDRFRGGVDFVWVDDQGSAVRTWEFGDHELLGVRDLVALDDGRYLVYSQRTVTLIGTDGDVDWSATVGDEEGDAYSSETWAVAPTGDGVLVVGRSILESTDDRFVWTETLDSLGRLQDRRRFTDLAWGEVGGLVPTEEGTYLTFGTASDEFFTAAATFDADGSLVSDPVEVDYVGRVFEVHEYDERDSDAAYLALGDGGSVAITADREVVGSESYSSEGLIYSLGMSVRTGDEETRLVGGLSHDDTPHVVQMRPNRPPVAEFTYSPQNPTVGEPITFDPSPSSDPDGNLKDYYRWQFDSSEGLDAIDSEPTHTYEEAGNYEVTLIVADEVDARHSTTETLTVTERTETTATAARTPDTTTEVTEAATDTDTPADGDTPGFGALSALVGVAGLTEFARRRFDDEE